MINRREFLKAMVGTGISSVMPAPLLFDKTFNAEDRKQLPASVECEEIPKENRIYYLADNIELYMKIYRAALSMGCEIFSLQPYSADGMSLNGFIYIIDRNYVGKEWWDHHVRCRDKYGWREPCLLIDAIKDMNMPTSTYAEQFDVNGPPSINSMINSIKEARAQNILCSQSDRNKI